MARYICIFYTTKKIEEIDKSNKVVKVIEKESWSECYNELNNKFNFPLIKYIRNINDSNPIIYNKEFIEIEEKNNSKLKKIHNAI